MKPGVFGSALILGIVGQMAYAETPIERGSYLVNSIGACGNCHGRDASGNNFYADGSLAGGVSFDTVDPDLPGHVIAQNITPDKDTGIGKWSETDIVFALRNGKRPDGRIIGPPMPIPFYRQLSDQDTTAIAAYLLSARPAKNAVKKSQYTIQLTEYGSPVTHVDAPSPEDKIAYGAYLVTFGHCVACHTPPGENGEPLNMTLAFAGGRQLGSIGQISPSVSRNITSDPDYGLGKWTDDQIKTAITKGVRPDGTKLGGPMAFDWYAKITPGDLDAIVAYLRTIKPVKNQ